MRSAATALRVPVNRRGVTGDIAAATVFGRDSRLVPVILGGMAAPACAGRRYGLIEFYLSPHVSLY
jgi:hypothetical protein